MLDEIAEIKADGIITKEEIAAQRLSAQKSYKEFACILFIFITFLSRGLAQCPNCSRTFESAAFEKHIKSCRVRSFTFGCVVDNTIPDDDEDSGKD